MTSSSKSGNTKENRNLISDDALNSLHRVEESFGLLDTAERENFMSYCEDLLVHAIDEQSDYLYASAYYYIMFYYANTNDTSNAISSALEGIKYQQQCGEYEKMARSYNLLGVLYATNGDYPRSVEYLLTCLDLSRKNELDYIYFMAASNLADVFHLSTNYSHALRYYNESKIYFEKSGMELNESNCYVLASLLSNYGHCLLSVGMTERAAACADELLVHMENANKLGITIPAFIVNTFLANVDIAQQKWDNLDMHMDKAAKEFGSCDNYIVYVHDINYYVDACLYLKRYSEATEILDKYIDRCMHDNAAFNISSLFIQKRIECATLLKNDDDCHKYTKMFYDLYQKERIRSSDHTIRAVNAYEENIRIQKQQYEMMLQNQELLVQSQHDTLTGLPNRAYLNSYAEETLSKANKNRKSLGIEILDIDYFKSINDGYGHMEGDHCLKSVSKLLQMLSDEHGIFAARYGGDEFVIVYYDKTDDEIINIMDSLKNSTRQIKLNAPTPVGCDYLTLSQGCVNKTPRGVNRLWDFLSIADTALYKVKESGRDNYLLKK